MKKLTRLETLDSQFITELFNHILCSRSKPRRMFLVLHVTPAEVSTFYCFIEIVGYGLVNDF